MIFKKLIAGPRDSFAWRISQLCMHNHVACAPEDLTADFISPKDLQAHLGADEKSLIAALFPPGDPSRALLASYRTHGHAPSLDLSGLADYFCARLNLYFKSTDPREPIRSGLSDFFQSYALQYAEGMDGISIGGSPRPAGDRSPLVLDHCRLLGILSHPRILSDETTACGMWNALSSVRNMLPSRRHMYTARNPHGSGPAWILRHGFGFSQLRTWEGLVRSDAVWGSPNALMRGELMMSVAEAVGLLSMQQPQGEYISRLRNLKMELLRRALEGDFFEDIRDQIIYTFDMVEDAPYLTAAINDHPETAISKLWEQVLQGDFSEETIRVTTPAHQSALRLGFFSQK